MWGGAAVPDLYTGPGGRIRMPRRSVRLSRGGQSSGGELVMRDRGEIPHVFGYFGGGGFAFGVLERRGLRITPDTYARYRQATASGVFRVVYTNGDYVDVVLGTDLPLWTQLRPTDRAYFQHDWASAEFLSVPGNDIDYRRMTSAQRTAFIQIQADLITDLRTHMPSPPPDSLFFTDPVEYGRQGLIYLNELNYYLQAVTAFPLIKGALSTADALRDAQERLTLALSGRRLFRRTSMSSEVEDLLPPGAAAFLERFETYLAENVTDYGAYNIGSNIGQIMGSTIGNYLGGSNPLNQIVASSVLGTIGQNLGQAIAVGGFSRPVILNGEGGIRFVANNVLDDVGAEFLTNLQSAAVGTISSMLALELGNALGLEGFGAELFSSAGSSVIGGVLNNLINFGPNNAFKGFNFSDVF